MNDTGMDDTEPRQQKQETARLALRKQLEKNLLQVCDSFIFLSKVLKFILDKHVPRKKVLKRRLKV
jgi:hypothetical protein